MTLKISIAFAERMGQQVHRHFLLFIRYSNHKQSFNTETLLLFVFSSFLLIQSTLPCQYEIRWLSHEKYRGLSQALRERSGILLTLFEKNTLKIALSRGSPYTNTHTHLTLRVADCCEHRWETIPRGLRYPEIIHQR